MNPHIRLVIADDHEIFLDGLCLMLGKCADIRVVGNAANGRELLELVTDLKPDVVLTDIKMPLMDGVEVTRRICEIHPDIGVIALSMFDEDHLVVDMLEAGAKGYLLKNAGKQEILDAIHAVFNNNTYYCRQTTNKLAGMIAKSRFNPYKKKETIAFADKEREIIRYICMQLTAQEIADRVFLSRRTVEGYRVKILEKMNVKNAAGVVVYALKNGLVKEEDILNEQ
jgi:two-component system, NarL family, response regulator NreC